MSIAPSMFSFTLTEKTGFCPQRLTVDIDTRERKESEGVEAGKTGEAYAISVTHRSYGRE